MPKVTQPTIEQIWIARLFDTSCQGGYGRVISERTMPIGKRLLPMTNEKGSPNSIRADAAQPALSMDREARDLVGSAQPQR